MKLAEYIKTDYRKEHLSIRIRSVFGYASPRGMMPKKLHWKMNGEDWTNEGWKIPKIGLGMNYHPILRRFKHPEILFDGDDDRDPSVAAASIIAKTQRKNII